MFVSAFLIPFIRLFIFTMVLLFFVPVAATLCYNVLRYHILQPYMM
jgi:hypothetical protein